jgi:hypothetical protein
LAILSKSVPNNGQQENQGGKPLLAVYDKEVWASRRSSPSNHRANEVADAIVFEHIPPKLIEVAAVPAVWALKTRYEVVVASGQEFLDGSPIRLEIRLGHSTSLPCSSRHEI